MEPIDVYLMYCAMKAHFGKGDYDYIKYSGKTRISRKSFWKRKDRYFFVKLSKKYSNPKVVQNWFLANFIQDKRGYIANFNDENYESWKDCRENFLDEFNTEMRPLVHNFEPLFEQKNHDHPKLLKEYLGKRVSIETMIILDELLGYGKKWDKKLSEDIVWPDIKKMMNNYKRFLTLDVKQCRISLLNLIEEAS